MSVPQSTNGDTKRRLMLAGERLFARDGIRGALVREITELAGQRNPSALHYHFGSRHGLVEAILLEHQLVIDVAVGERLDELEARGGLPAVREVVESSVRPLALELTTQSGRDFLRIVPQMIHQLSDNLRRGEMRPVTPQARRVLALLDESLGNMPEPVRRERLASFTVVISSLLADRAKHIEGHAATALDLTQYVDNLCDVLVALVTAPSTVVDGVPQA
jgi:TetR/AcrR family transcriptional regulator, regulator of cefoperazone and chloramphenicol sensitivity